MGFAVHGSQSIWSCGMPKSLQVACCIASPPPHQQNTAQTFVPAKRKASTKPTAHVYYAAYLTITEEKYIHLIAETELNYSTLLNLKGRDVATSSVRSNQLASRPRSFYPMISAAVVDAHAHFHLTLATPFLRLTCLTSIRGLRRYETTLRWGSCGCE